MYINLKTKQEMIQLGCKFRSCSASTLLAYGETQIYKAIEKFSAK